MTRSEILKASNSEELVKQINEKISYFKGEIKILGYQTTNYSQGIVEYSVLILKTDQT